jgi:hypothetical protein
MAERRPTTWSDVTQCAYLVASQTVVLVPNETPLDNNRSHARLAGLLFNSLAACRRLAAHIVSCLHAIPSPAGFFERAPQCLGRLLGLLFRKTFNKTERGLGTG